MIEVREVLRAWLGGAGLRTVAQRAGVDRKTVRRYVAATEAAGVARDGSLDQLTDDVIGQVVAAVRPARTSGHGKAWEALEAEHARIAEWVKEDLSVVRSPICWPGGVCWCRTARCTGSAPNGAGSPRWPHHGAGRRRRAGRGVPDRLRPDGAGLRPGLGPASRLDCLLVVFCSHQAKADDFAALAAEWPGLQWVAVDLPDGYHHQMLKFNTSAIRDVKVRRLGDLSVKRNLGLLLAWLAGWTSIMFLDDDITGIDPVAVSHATGGLGRRLAIVGLTVDDYPDNSVVCHANRLAGGDQDVFVTGSAMLVRCDRPGSFFPEVYNEDWLFFFESVLDRAVAKYGRARQLPYDPFSDPVRAVGEEFGDVLAEGLLGLLHDAQPVQAATDDAYWRRFLRSRRAFIERTASQLTCPEADENCRAALRALQAAENRRKEISPSSIAAYIRTWRRDRRVWARRLAALDRPGALEAALQVLDLHHYTLRSDGSARDRAHANCRAPQL